MFKIKYYLWAFLLLCPGITFPQSGKHNDMKKWIINESSNLSVKGVTNVNTFACDIPAYAKTDTLIVSKHANSKDISLSGNISLRVQSFDCHNSIMTHDLRKTLNEKQYPHLFIRFLTLSEWPEPTTKAVKLTGLVMIELAGISKQYEVDYLISMDAQKNVHLIGSRKVKFSDFKLQPPRKLGGMIRTKDELSVDFHLKIKEIGD